MEAIFGAYKTGETSDELPFTKEQAEKWSTLTGKYLKDALYFSFKKFVPENRRNRKEKVNEHLMVGLSYPKDDKLIRQIFENLVVYWKLGSTPETEGRFPTKDEVDDFRKNEYPEKLKDTPPRVYLGDAHPFHLAYIARSMGVPLEFTFTVGSLDKEESGDDKGKRTPHKTMTLKELIEYEKQHLSVGINTSGYYESMHHDAEWLLMLLNLEGVKDKKTVVGKNLLGKTITYGDVVSCVEEEVGDVKYKRGGLELNSDWTLGGDNLDWGNKETSQIRKTTPREFAQSHMTCNGVHAADALLSSGKLSKEATAKYIDLAFKRIYGPFLKASSESLDLNKKTSEVTEYFKNKIGIMGHAIEFYLHHKNSLRPEQRQFFKYMIKDLPKLMAELEESIKKNKVYISLGGSISHLHEVFQELFNQ